MKGDLRCAEEVAENCELSLYDCIKPGHRDCVRKRFVAAIEQARREGAEAMRERIALELERQLEPAKLGASLAREIRALPLEPE